MGHGWLPVVRMADCGSQYSVAIVQDETGREDEVTVDLNANDATSEPRIIFANAQSVVDLLSPLS